ncbi:MAG: LON peptidase substrate-binding domain-containing protein [Armatimonadetes bacterium]|nr:LON peptidase substrate-binding domain-containing protein [Armatimonadota bacterium]
MLIGLFPLNIVLFPGSLYPLRIFEPRYKLLIREAIDSNGVFGINLVEESKMANVGCLAKVEKVLHVYPDGKMEIVVAGTERFRIDRYHDGDKPYLVAEVNTFEDEINAPPDFELLENTIRLYNQLAEVVYGEAEPLLEPSQWITGGAAFRIAQKSGLDLSLRQNMLEMLSENERLSFLHQYLKELIPKVKEYEAMHALSRNDGYLREQP